MCIRDRAYTEYAAYTAQVRRKGEETLEEARRRNLPVIVLCGRPYHLDPEINHGIDELILSLIHILVNALSSAPDCALVR